MQIAECKLKNAANNFGNLHFAFAAFFRGSARKN